MTEYNFYCDESCHLEHDNSNVMVLGAVWCPKDKRHEIRRQKEENEPGQRKLNLLFILLLIHFTSWISKDDVVKNHKGAEQNAVS